MRMGKLTCPDDVIKIYLPLPNLIASLYMQALLNTTLPALPSDYPADILSGKNGGMSLQCRIQLSDSVTVAAFELTSFMSDTVYHSWWR
jgi:hypothetical protein